MLSAPVKSAKRISSLFSLGSNKDSVSSSPVSPGFKSSPDQVPQDASRPRSASRPTRIVSQPNLDSSNDHFNLDEPLPPPPSLLAVNQDLASSPTSGPDGRPQSRGRRRSSSRPASAAGLFVPGGSDSRPSTPSKRRSWIPGRARASSVDTRGTLMPASPQPQPPSSGAWIAGLDQRIAYDLNPLAQGEQVCFISRGRCRQRKSS